MWTDFRIKFLRFFRKNKLLIFIVLCIVVIIVTINLMLKNYQPVVVPQTTYEPHVSIMDEDEVPTKVANEVETLIEEYVEYCNDADWLSAYNMLSEECKEIEFNNSVEKFMSYVYTKMPTPKQYSIQDYSNDGDTYIYQIKYTDDMLATGLTNSTYSYTEEKMVFKKTSNGIEMSVGNFVDYQIIDNVFENEYLKIDVENVIKYYSVEKYKVKITNRSNYFAVIKDGEASEEVALKLESGDLRSLSDNQTDTVIVLKPQSSIEGYLIFPKFSDNENDAKQLIFNSIRIMEKYSGTTDIPDEVKQEEIQNAIAKFGVTISVKTE